LGKSNEKLRKKKVKRLSQEGNSCTVAGHWKKQTSAKRPKGGGSAATRLSEEG